MSFDVFISYSRNDLDLARQIFEEVKNANITAWIDWQNIPHSAGWWDEIIRGINAASTFVFLMSNSSLGSAVCALELAHAIETGKRIIPVCIESPNFNTAIPVQPADQLFKRMLDSRDLFDLVENGREILKQRNWIFFNNNAQGAPITFEDSFKHLTIAINTNLERERMRARLLIRMHDWESVADENRQGDFLLIGSEIDDAEVWYKEAIVVGIGESDQSFQKLEAYIQKSRAEATERRRKLQELEQSRKTSEFAAKKAQQEVERAEISRKNARRTLAVVAVLSLLLVTLAVLFSSLQVQDSQEQLLVANTQIAGAKPTLSYIQTQIAQLESARLVSLSELTRSDLNQDPTLAALFALRAYRLDQSPDAIEELQLAAQDLRVVDRILINDNHPESNAVISISENGGRMIIGNTVWNVETKKPIRQLFQIEKNITSNALSPNGEFAAVAVSFGSNDPNPEVTLWNVQTGELLRTWSVRSYSLEFSSDSKILVLSDYRQRIAILIDVTTGIEISRFDDQNSGHGGFKATLSPDQIHIATTGGETVTIWNVQSGENLGEFGNTDAYIVNLSFIDSNTLVATGSFGVVNAWRYSSLEWTPWLSNNVGFSSLNAKAELPTTVYAMGYSKNIIRIFDFDPYNDLAGEGIYLRSGEESIESFVVLPSTVITTGKNLIQFWDTSELITLPDEDIELVDFICTRIDRDFTETELSLYNLTNNDPSC